MTRAERRAALAAKLAYEARRDELLALCLFEGSRRERMLVRRAAIRWARAERLAVPEVK